MGERKGGAPREKVPTSAAQPSPARLGAVDLRTALPPGEGRGGVEPVLLVVSPVHYPGGQCMYML